MINLKFNIKYNKTQINKVKKAQITALMKTVEALHSEIIQSQVMPFDTGNMQNSSTFVDDSNIKNGFASLVTQTPYARRLYYHPEYNFRTDNNPHAQGRWLDSWINGKNKNFVSKTYEYFLSREMNK